MLRESLLIMIVMYGYVAVAEDSTIALIEKELQLKFPQDAVVIANEKGRDSGRDTAHWVIQTGQKVDLPKIQVGTEKVYLRRYLKTDVAVVETYLKGRKIPNPRASFTTHWMIEGSQVQGTVVESGDGRYFVLLAKLPDWNRPRPAAKY